MTRIYDAGPLFTSVTTCERGPLNKGNQLWRACGNRRLLVKRIVSVATTIGCQVLQSSSILDGQLDAFAWRFLMKLRRIAFGKAWKRGCSEASWHSSG